MMATASSFTKVTVLASMSVSEAKSLVTVLKYVQQHNEIFTATVFNEAMDVLRSLEEARDGASITRR